MATAIYYDPGDYRRGVIAQAFLSVPEDPDTSWSSWYKYIASWGEPQPSLQARSRAALVQWHALIQKYGWSHSEVIITAAVFCAANKGILTQFLTALTRIAGPSIANKASSAAEQSRVEYAAEFADVFGKEEDLLKLEVKILSAMDTNASLRDGLFYGTVGIGIAGAAWLLAGRSSPKK